MQSGGRAAAVWIAATILSGGTGACSSDEDPPGGAGTGGTAACGDGGAGGGLGQVVYEPFVPGPCSQRAMQEDDNGQAFCTLFEVAPGDQGCAAAGRAPLCRPDVVASVEEYDPGLEGSAFCALEQLSGEALVACKQDVEEPSGVSGWCYLSAELGAFTGNPELVADCPETEKRRVRFIGMGTLPRDGGQLFLFCGTPP